MYVNSEYPEVDRSGVMKGRMMEEGRRGGGRGGGVCATFGG